jgi:hypothetical protein
MTARPPKEVLVLDMPFGEALERYVGSDSRELHALVARSKRKKPTARKKKKKKPSIRKRK